MGLFGKKTPPPPPPAPAGARVIAQGQANAKALDAADGKMDGKYYGAKIYSQSPQHSQYPAARRYPPAPQPQYPPVPQYQHTPRPQYAPAPTTYGHTAAPSYTRYSGPSYSGYSHGGTVVGANQYAAYALDAADGVIDGKHFGSQVYTAGGHTGYGYEPGSKVINVEYVYHEAAYPAPYEPYERYVPEYRPPPTLPYPAKPPKYVKARRPQPTPPPPEPPRPPTPPRPP
eukprot:CAMPEP_0174287372 /NCGR_PEP_ID=MMETSP0809-20121228/15783_1 /TAXON_ID=73025 ORGANISM="Eutreptiella gymnastica-like, Strain CCMP1594" /NCGR_SAMPLE_ID=MMETSP0809 /ASSEMBLY_ACC=CAM_ASM_000658 /LENGTH=228 /DNA_ID=CAMNT_0015383915 /DNA_START=36 /DNA_END=719 /DNA_ORIENTATION=+